MNTYGDRLRPCFAAQAAVDGGAAAGFMFEASAEFQDAFMVHAADIATFHETAV